jgi:hypothetical protein
VPETEVSGFYIPPYQHRYDSREKSDSGNKEHHQLSNLVMVMGEDAGP